MSYNYKDIFGVDQLFWIWLILEIPYRKKAIISLLIISEKYSEIFEVSISTQSELQALISGCLIS